MIKLAMDVFGCFEPKKEEGTPDKIQKLIDERAQARAAKNFSESDRLRDEIAKRGFEVRDTSEGQVVKKL
jgi:cysteinyl-tRNA synthetase